MMLAGAAVLAVINQPADLVQSIADLVNSPIGAEYHGLGDF